MSRAWSASIAVRGSGRFAIVVATLGFSLLAPGAAEAQAPPAPTNLTATPAAGRITLGFSATGCGSGDEIQYRVKSGSGAYGSPASLTNCGPGSSYSVAVTSLTNGTRYAFQVRSANVNGASLWTNEASAVPATSPTPSAPTNVTAEGRPGSVLLTWTASSSTADSEYRVWTQATGACAVPGSPPAWTQVPGGAVTSYQVPGLADSTRYCAQLRALNGTLTSAASAAVDATTTVNTVATGKPSITGREVRVTQVLTATPGSIADADGLPAGGFPAGYLFQWIRSDSGTDTEIAGATSPTYTLQGTDQLQGDRNFQIKVKVAFTDAGGGTENLTSDWVGRVYSAQIQDAAPRFSSAAVSGTSLVVTFTSTLRTTVTPALANSRFRVKKTPSGGVEQNVTLTGSPSISGSTVTLTLDEAVVATDTGVNVSYFLPAGSNSTNSLASQNGNHVAPAFADMPMSADDDEGGGGGGGGGGPRATGYSPADGATGVAADADLVLEFDRPVRKGASGAVVIRPASGPDVVVRAASRRISVGAGADANVVTIDPAEDLDYGAEYHVTIDRGAIEDLSSGAAWAGIADSTTWNFTTADPPCSRHVAPYWHGEAALMLRSADGASVEVETTCGGETASSAEFGELIVREASCKDEDGAALAGSLAVTGAAPGGWYYVRGGRNVAVAPLMCASLFEGETVRAAVAGGTMAARSGNGTFVRHDATGLIGIVPDLPAGGTGSLRAPYWRGWGGVVGKASDGEGVDVEYGCLIVPLRERLSADPDTGIVSALLRPANCKSEDGRLFVGDLEVRGMEDGGWYWLDGPSGGPPAVAPLVRSSLLDEDVEPVDPGNPGVTIHRGRHGTLFEHAEAGLAGVVPHLED